MDYRFSITPRLLILAALSLLALFTLLFLLGIWVGQHLGPVSVLGQSNLTKMSAPQLGSVPAEVARVAATASPPAAPPLAAPAVQAKP